MTTKVHLTADAEPLELHGVANAGQTQVFGVHLAMQELGETEEVAETRTAGFLDGLSAGSFLLLDLSGGAVADTGVDVKTITPVKSRPSAEVMDWLQNAKQGFAELEDLRLSAAELAKTAGKVRPFFSRDEDRGEGASFTSASAFDLLSATAKWPAPMAQYHGLMRAVSFDQEIQEASQLVLVWLPPDQDFVSALAAQVDEKIEVTLRLKDADGEEANYIQVTSLLVAYKGDNVGLGLKDSGIFDLSGGDELRVRLLARIEAEGPTLLWSAISVTSMGLAPEFVAEFLPEPLPGQTKLENLRDDTPLPRSVLDWIKKAAGVSLFDVTISGLLLPVLNVVPVPVGPGSVIKRQSTVLQRLSRRIAAAFDTAAEASGQISPVDEPELYAALHVALWRRLAGLTVGDIATQLREEFADHELGRVIAALDATPNVNNPDTVSWQKWQDELHEFSGELGDLALVLEGEESAESWMLDRFGEAFHTDEKLFGAVDFRKARLQDVDLSDPANPDADLDAKYLRLLDRAHADFVADITGPFDAAEAVRRDFGADVVASVLGIGDLGADLPGKNLFDRRFPEDGMLGRDPNDPFLNLFLPCIHLNRLDDNGVQNPPHPGRVLEKGLKDFGTQRLRELVTLPDGTAAPFRPDATPQPLHLPLLNAGDTDVLDGLAGRISGLGFLVGASFDEGAIADGSISPDHVCLIGIGGVGVGDLDDDDNSFVTVEPILPMPIPGTSGLFLPYEGQPISSPSRATPGSGGAPISAAEQAAMSKTQAYSRSEAKVVKLPTSEYQTDIAVPELSYGAFYAAAGFWVPPSGVLPTFVRATAEDPPTNKGAYQPINPAPGSVQLTSPVRYHRRTAIAETVVTDPQAGRPLAKGLHPLALDDPRLVVERQREAARHVDLYRREDGTGALMEGDYLLYLKAEGAPDSETPTEDVEVLTLSGVDLGGLTRGDLTVAVHTSAEQSVDAILDLAGTSFAITVGPGETAWLRLGLAPDPASAAIAFDDPAHEKGQDSAGRTGAMVLLSPTEAGWTEPVNRTVTLDMPRVSFTDLERWASNTKLWAETSGLAEVDAAKLLEDLRMARAIYESLPGPVAQSWVDKLNALPDPAVSGLYIGAAISDGVFRSGIAEAGRSVGRFQSMSPYAEAVDFDFPGFVNDGTTPPAQVDAILDAMKPVGKAIDDIIAAGRTTMTLSGASDGSLLLSNTNVLTVPAGQIARLWVSPAVRSALIDPPPGASEAEMRKLGIFDAHIAHLSCGTYTPDGGDAHMLFDGAKLVVEVMASLAEETFARDPIAALATATERGYAVQTTLSADQRIYSQAVLTTQRWQPTGRPIYSYIDPAPETPSTGPVVVLDGEAAAETPINPVDVDALMLFEAEAFIGRQPSDGEVTEVRLLPAPDATQLWQLAWPETSATYLRHSASFRSRYAAAMTQQKKKETTTASNGLPFVLRVAILADAIAAAPTRPQLRTHLPLQRRVDGESLTPPIACVLHEPPHAQLGLADRVVADLVYTNVFEVNDTLELKDLRKEVGPDPLLAWHPVNGDMSKQCRIEVEGPVGLHFEGPSTRAPAYPNCQYLLQPMVDMELAVAQLAELEESFAGISLSRYSDPHWVWQSPEVITAVPTMDAECWVELAAEFNLSAGGQVILSRGVDGTIKALKTALYEDGGTGTVTISEASDDVLVDALLLKPLDAVRLRVSLFRNAETGLQGAGRSNRPILVGSVILRVTGELTFIGSEATKTVRQSEATFARWVKTSRDMAHLLSVVDGTDNPVEVAEIMARRNGTSVLLADAGVTITSPVSRRRYPLHVHRRLVHLLRRHAPQIGAPVPLFHSAALANGTGGSTLARAAEADSLQLAEMEMRASIHLVNNGGKPPNPEFLPYHKAVFDLAGSRVSREGHRQLRFFIRAATGDLVRNGLKCQLDLQGADGTPLLSARLDLPDGDAVRTAELIVFSHEGTVNLCAAVQLGGGAFFDLAETQVDTRNAMFLLEAAATAELTLSNTDDAECWTDISVLHAVARGQNASAGFNAADPYAFDFDWIFGGDPPELPDALYPTELNLMPEAQARFVGMTQPIPLSDAT
jgi:hypothetical protein